MRGISKTRFTTASDRLSVNARSSRNSDRKSYPIYHASLVDLGRTIRDAFASPADSTGLESLDKNPVESYLRALHYLSVDIVGSSAATAFWRVFVTIAGCTLVVYGCGYGLPSGVDSDVQDTHVGAAGNDVRDAEVDTADSVQNVDGSLAAKVNRTDGDTTDVFAQEGDGSAADGIAQGGDSGASDNSADKGGADDSVGDPDGSAADSGDSETDGDMTDEDAQEPISAPDQNNCCSAHAESGCADIDVQTCVCELDPECCQESWDTVCVEFVSLVGCGDCGQPTGDCCTASLSSGCGDPAIQACVCAADPKCCNEEWDEFCVFLIDQLGCGSCD